MGYCWGRIHLLQVPEAAPHILEPQLLGILSTVLHWRLKVKPWTKGKLCAAVGEM